jgi:hypothetical protein
MTKMYTIDIGVGLALLICPFFYYFLARKLQKRFQQVKIHRETGNPLNETEYEEVEMREVNDIENNHQPAPR